jgi:hypothetical protein
METTKTKKAPVKKATNAPSEKQADAPNAEDEAKKVRSKRIAALVVSSTFNAAALQKTLASGGNPNLSISLGDVLDALREKIQPVVKGNMAEVETMLLSQACTLDLLFGDLLLKARASDTMPKMESYMRMALKSQQQAASTLRILGELKSPKQIAFIKQANVAHQQQVNNGTPPPATRAHEESGSRSNELLEHQHGERLDIRAAGHAGRGNQAMEAVGTVNRADDRPR